MKTYRIPPVCKIAVSGVFLMTSLLVISHADDPNQHKWEPRSAHLSFGDGAFRVSGTDTNHLILEHEKRGSTRTWKITPEQIIMTDDETKRELWPSADAPQTVRAIAIARRKPDCIMLVVKTVHSKKGYFWGMLLPDMTDRPADETNLAPAAILMTKRNSDERILALSADVESPAITLVTGKMSDDGSGQIERGSITCELCGMLYYATTTEFVRVVPDKKTGVDGK